MNGNAMDFKNMERGPSFDRARTLAATPFQYVDIPLDTAGSNVVFNVSGDFLYCDVSSDGIATMELNNQYNDPAAPFQIQANFAISAIFKQIKVSWAAQSGKKLRIMYSTGDRVIPANSGIQNVTISGTPTVKIYDDLEYTNSFSSVALSPANTALQVFPASQNINGVILIRAYGVSDQAGVAGNMSLLAKSTAPTSIIDGDVIGGMMFTTSSQNQAYVEINGPIKIPKNKGLYFWIPNAESNRVFAFKSALYKVL